MDRYAWPPPKHKPIANREIAPAPRFLVDAMTAAAALSISERTFHSLRKRSEFPQDATVVLGPRCVRFRLDALQVFATSLLPGTLTEPRQLRESRKARSKEARQL